MSTAVEVTGFIMAVISFLVTGTSLSNDYWKISTVSGSVIISQRQFENLWHACAENSAGIAECRDFDSLLGLPGKTRNQNHNQIRNISKILDRFEILLKKFIVSY